MYCTVYMDEDLLSSLLIQRIKQIGETKRTIKDKTTQNIVYFCPNPDITRTYGRFGHKDCSAYHSPHPFNQEGLKGWGEAQAQFTTLNPHVWKYLFYAFYMNVCIVQYI